MINKTSWKFIAGFLALIAVGIAILLISSYANPQAKEERTAKQYLNDLRAQYENDTFGGDTPEETLSLFIDALEKGDVELASKYFVIDEQEKWLNNLGNIKENELLGEMTKDLKNLEKTKETENEVFYILTNEKNIVSVQLIIGKNYYNNQWKIYEL